MRRLNRYYNLLIIVVVLFLTACSNVAEQKSTDYDREDMLFRYLNDHTSINTKEEFILVLINATDCGACNAGALNSVISKLDYDDRLKTIYLFSQPKEELLKQVTEKDAEIQYIDNMAVLQKYGLRYFKPFIFHIKDEKIAAWDTALLY